MKCNKCKSSNVQKYQVIHEQGTSSINLDSNTAGGGVGTNGQVLTSTGTGVQYATPAAGGADEQLIVMQAL